MSGPGPDPVAREGQRLGLRPGLATGLGFGSCQKDEALSLRMTACRKGPSTDLPDSGPTASLKPHTTHSHCLAGVPISSLRTLLTLLFPGQELGWKQCLLSVW